MARWARRTTPASRTGSSTSSRECFPEKLPGPWRLRCTGCSLGGRAGAAGRVHEEDHRLSRVGNNCAVCHTATYRTKPDEAAVFVVASPGHTTNVEGFFRFLIDCAKDPRFNADNLMSEINLVTKLDLIDKALYRFFIIPITKKRLLQRERSSRGSIARIFPSGAAAATTR
jgi:hypothetical protein